MSFVCTLFLVFYVPRLKMEQNWNGTHTLGTLELKHLERWNTPSGIIGCPKRYTLNPVAYRVDVAAEDSRQSGKAD